MDARFLDEVHEFWFGSLPEFKSFNADRFALWFFATPETDRLIAERFGDALRQAAEAEWPIDALSSSQKVSLVVLFDQFPRNIYRGTAAAYSFDPKALALARRVVEAGLDPFKLVERSFLIIPFSHSEQLADQKLGAGLFERFIAPDAPPGNRFYEAGRIQTAKLAGIIERFGRFPHRNAALGRTTTAAEATFLETTPLAPF
jgi:uncharacterized protein (DUF924 family)